MVDRSDRSVAASYAARTSSPSTGKSGNPDSGKKPAVNGSTKAETREERRPPEPDCDCPDGWKHEPTCVVVTGANPFCLNPDWCKGAACPRDPVCGN